MSAINSDSEVIFNEDTKIICPWKAVTFSCGGWLQFYLFGVARAMQVRGLDKNIKCAGCSAGALAAAGLVLGVSLYKYTCICYCKLYTFIIILG